VIPNCPVARPPHTRRTNNPEDWFRPRTSRDAGDGQQGEHTIALYERALDRDPNNHLLLFDLARAYAERGWRGRTGQMLERVLGLYPNSATVQFKAARLYGQSDGQIAAIKCYRRALELEPRHPQATEILVEMSILAGRYGKDRATGEDAVDHGTA